MTNLWSDSEFTEMWTTYIEYLMQDHGMTLNEDQKIKALEIIKEISDNDIDKAIEILEYLIRNWKITIYLPTDDQFEDSYNADNDLNE